MSVEPTIAGMAAPTFASRTYLAVSFLMFFLVYLALKYIKATTLPVPKSFRAINGPKGVPFLGNASQIPPANPQRLFKQWAREHGELYQIQLGFQRWVFSNSGEAVKEIIDKQSSVTSSRQPMITADIVSGSRRILLDAVRREMEDTEKHHPYIAYAEEFGSVPT